jgi:hypothetical protein
MSHLRPGQRELLFDDVDFVGKVTENYKYAEQQECYGRQRFGEGISHGERTGTNLRLSPLAALVSHEIPLTQPPRKVCQSQNT